MADFIVNSTQTKALRKSEVLAYEIQEYEIQHEDEIETGYHLLVKMSRGFDPDVVFEQAESLEAMESLVATFHTQLNG